VPKAEAPASILDASALLALLQGEPGAPVVIEAIEAGAAISTVNFSEVLAKLTERGDHVRATVAVIRKAVERADGGLRIESFTEEDGIEAADLRPRSKRQGLSFGDRACLALAARFEVPAVTADRDWADLPEVGVAVKLIR
jgi:PIN domain nuclease of toxin-antitoxin system